jgi:hypothetical protein
VSLGRTQLQAMQTFVNIGIAENGKPSAGTTKTTFRYRYNVPQSGTPVVGFRVETLTPTGKAEYEALTGDTTSFFYNGENPAGQTGKLVMPRVFCTPDGDIKLYNYINTTDYFGHTLTIYYVKDINSTDPVTVEIINNYWNQTTVRPYLTNGFNIFWDGKKQN